MKSKADLIVHPIRMRILQALAGRQLTTAQLSDRLPDVPPSTLYRHMSLLSDAGLLLVVETNQIRGTTEKVYTLASGGASVPETDLASMTKDDHMRLFIQFAGLLLGDFGKYLSRDSVDLYKDGVSYRQASFYLSDPEVHRFLGELREVYARYAGFEPGEGRSARKLTTIIMPD